MISNFIFENVFCLFILFIFLSSPCFRLRGREWRQLLRCCRLHAEALHLLLPARWSHYLRRGHCDTGTQTGVRFPARLQPLQTLQAPAFSVLQLFLFLPLPVVLFHPEAQPVDAVWPRAQAHPSVATDRHPVPGGLQPLVGGVGHSAELLLSAASCRCGLEQPAEATYHSEPAGGRAEHVLPPVDRCKAASR